jgi:hypothetical protein
MGTGKDHAALNIRLHPATIMPGHEEVEIEVWAEDMGDITHRRYTIDTKGYGTIEPERRTIHLEQHFDQPVRFRIKTADLGSGQVPITVMMVDESHGHLRRQLASTEFLHVSRREDVTRGAGGIDGGPGDTSGNGGGGGIPIPLPVTLTRTRRRVTDDEILWVVIRNSAGKLSFDEYLEFMDQMFYGESPTYPTGTAPELGAARRRVINSQIRLPFPGVDAYRTLKAATEVFVLGHCGVKVDFSATDFGDLLRRMEADWGLADRDGDRVRFLDEAWHRYLEKVNGIPGRSGSQADALPYLAIVRRKLAEVPVIDDPRAIHLYGILQEKLTYPCMIELIWSYWHEEGMLVQTMNAISNRFQNRTFRDLDPLANLEIDPLRPLNNILWGYIQDEQHQLSVKRRAFEYEHHYGISLYGKAVGTIRPAERRSKFLEAFHNLLYQCIQFFRQDDDTTVVADAFPVLNSVKETHYLLAQGAHNQFGDLPSTARQEMLLQQWLLARPEMREFLGGRVMVPYPEVWMDRVDAMKTLQGWTDVSVVHFHDLAVFGEQILLSIRYGGWSLVNDQTQAANWARFWRPEIQGYVHAYRAVTGVDLTTDITDVRQAQARYAPPSVHLQQRLAQQRRR